MDACKQVPAVIDPGKGVFFTLKGCLQRGISPSFLHANYKEATILQH
jgi:hypothetical protein